MANTVQLLNTASGIQFTGVQDKTGTDSATGLNTALIVGQFRRGRLDKPMTITQDNIRSELGYDKDNQDYQAVQDVLERYSSVDVLRVGGFESHVISCAGATNHVVQNNPFNGLWDLYIDDVLIVSDMSTNEIDAYLESYPEHGVAHGQVAYQDTNPYPDAYTTRYTGSPKYPTTAYILIETKTLDPVNYKRIRFVNKNGTGQGIDYYGNPTVVENANEDVSFCLSPSPAV